VRAGALIPAGQVWGGDPVTYIRELSEQELLANYTKSYTNGAAEFSSDASLWPHVFDDSTASGQSLEEYTQEKYYS
jgi:hypothetical protein